MYDESGNICKITENGELYTRYSYDSLNRLVREDNKKFGKTYVYEYDGNGNILSKKQTAFTLRGDLESCAFTAVEYGYDGDRLMSYGNETCEYDDVGNPKKYRGLTLKWEKGRQLAKIGDIELKYDAKGRRIKRGDVEYIYDDGGKLLKSSDGLEFYYDEAGVSGVKYNGTQYLYRKDAQGNIVALLDSNGAVVVKYVYDAWGNYGAFALNLKNGKEQYCDISDESIIFTGKYVAYKELAELNPFRYRGYYYDEALDLYYLQTRYYDPEIGRFITIDGIEYLDPETINGLNLYAYCGNNPVMFTDPDGTLKWWEWLLGIVIIVAAVALCVVTAGLAAPIATALGGGLAGAIIGGAVAGAVGGAITGFAFSVATQGISNGFNNIDWKQVGFDTLSGFVTGAIAGGVLGGLKYLVSAEKIANSVSGLSKASKNLNKAATNLSNNPISVKGGVMSTNRLAAQLIFDVASASYNYAKSVYNVVHFAVKYGYKIAQPVLKFVLGLFLTGERLWNTLN